MNTIVTKCSSIPGDEVATLRVPWPQLVAGRLLVPGDSAGPEHNLLSLQTLCLSTCPCVSAAALLIPSLKILPGSMDASMKINTIATNAINSFTYVEFMKPLKKHMVSMIYNVMFHELLAFRLLLPFIFIFLSFSSLHNFELILP